MTEQPGRPFRFWLPLRSIPAAIPSRRRPLQPQHPKSTLLWSQAPPQSSSQAHPLSLSPADPWQQPSQSLQPPMPSQAVSGRSSQSQPSEKQSTAAGATQPSQPFPVNSPELLPIKKASKSPSPSQNNSQSKPPPQERTPVASQPLFVSLLPETSTGNASSNKSKPLPPKSEPPVETTLSPKILQPKVKLQINSRAREHTPVIAASQQSQAENQPTVDSENKARPVTPLEMDVAAGLVIIPSSEPQKSKIELKRINGTKLETIPESKPEKEPSHLPKLEERSELTAEEDEIRQKENPTGTQESNTIFDEVDSDKPIPKPEIYKSQNAGGNQSKKRKDPMMNNVSSDAKPTRLSQKERELITEPKVEHCTRQEDASAPEPMQSGSDGKESKVAIATISIASYCKGERAKFQNEIKEGLSILVEKMGAGPAGYVSQPRIGAISMITLAGQSNGASMTIGYGNIKREGIFHINRGHELDKEGPEATTNRETRREERLANTSNGNQAITTSINSNVQIINNSALHDSSCIAISPGVHLDITREQTKAVNMKERIEPPRTQGTAPSIIPTQQPTREPRIRRRCLRALFLESSDDEDPRKPQRHGCRFRFDGKRKEKDEHDGTKAANTNAWHEEGSSRT